MNHRYNWRPDKPDLRDKKFADLKERELLKASAKVDLRPKCSPIVNQLQIGSCTGNAVAGGLEYLQNLEIRDNVPLTEAKQVFTKGKFEAISRLFVYYNERILEGTTGEDAGAEIRDGMKAISKWGICRESVWQYLDSQALARPTDAAYAEAIKHKCLSYYRINDGDVAAMKRCLTHGYPFVFGFTVYDSFESDQVASTGMVPMPSQTEDVLGGHAVLAVGYDDALQCFIVRNSWGLDWGVQGYFFMPYAYLQSTDLSSDFWTMRNAVV